MGDKLFWGANIVLTKNYPRVLVFFLTYVKPQREQFYKLFVYWLNKWVVLILQYVKWLFCFVSFGTEKCFWYNTGFSTTFIIFLSDHEKIRWIRFDILKLWGYKTGNELIFYQPFVALFMYFGKSTLFVFTNSVLDER